MLKIFPPLRFALSALCVLSLFGLRAYGQGRDIDEDKNRANDNPNGIVHDWSHRHVVYPRVGEIQSLIAVQHDPRAIQSWQEAERKDWHRERRGRHFRDHDRDDIATDLHIDWSISLGGGTTAPAMYPAKFGFNPNDSPDCTIDFVVFPVNIAGSATQPNIVAFNNLYSGGTSLAPTGLCGSRTVVSGDDRSSATTLWSYDINAAGGLVATSPALSIDGKKIAFVETVAGSSAHFHVLAYKSGDGVDVITPNAQNVLKPVIITSFTGLLAPVAGSGTASDLSFGLTGDTLSSPFVDYTKDVAYVGNDAGVLFRIKDVFCPTVPLIDAACAGGSPPAPSLDTTWGTSGALATGCTGKLTGAVVDGGTGHIFVGCSDGKLYGFTSTGTVITGSPLTVGNGGTDGGIVDPPLIDVIKGFAYVVSGASGVSGPQVVVQASTSDLSSNSTATLAAGGSFNLHAPAFNDAYFSSAISTNWLLFEVTGDSAANHINEYGITFNGSHVMTPSNPTNSNQFPAAAFEISPITTFLTAGGEDRLFESALGAFTNNIISLNISGGAFPTVPESFTTEGSGTTGIVVDNGSASPQADSLYFGVLGSNTAVKLTQGAFN